MVNGISKNQHNISVIVIILNKNMISFVLQFLSNRQLGSILFTTLLDYAWRTLVPWLALGHIILTSKF